MNNANPFYATDKKNPERKRRTRAELKMLKQLYEETGTEDLADIMGGYVSERTIKLYTIQWKAYLLFAKTKAAVFDVDTLRRWIQYLVNETTESPNTINLRINAVKSIVSYLGLMNRVEKTTAYDFSLVRLIPPNTLAHRKRRTSPLRLTKEDVHKLVRLPDAHRMNPDACQERALLYTFATTGMRISEIVKIKVEDIQEREGGFVIANIMGKRQGEAREAPISRDAVDAIRDWLYVRPFNSEFVFSPIGFDNLDRSFAYLQYSPKRADINYARSVVKRYAKRLGKPDITPHDLRRYVGTQLARRDIRVAQKVLGHKKLETTAKHYVLDDVPLGVTEDLA